MQLFYVPDLNNNEGFLSPVESRHAIKVLRLSIGDVIYVIDGKGGFFKAKINVPNPKKCLIQIIEKLEDPGKKAFQLHIAIAPTKNIDRTEWFLEKATEIGISRITPILCQRSERKTIKPERLEQILISAMKQSYKAVLPQLDELTSLNQFLKNESTKNKYIAHCNSDNLTLLKDSYSRHSDTLILIGPEGDFSNEEVELAKENGFKEISLGKSRLRTETAAVAACHSVAFANE